MIAYLKAIKADLAPSQRSVWNKLSVFIHPSSEENLTANNLLQNSPTGLKMALNTLLRTFAIDCCLCVAYLIVDYVMSYTIRSNTGR